MMAVRVSPEVYIGLPRPSQRHISCPIERIELKDILQKLLPCFGITEDELYGKSRLAHLVDARMIIVYLALKTGKQTTVSLGKAFKRDHSTMVYYRITVNDRMKFDKAYRARVEKAEELLFTL